MSPELLPCVEVEPSGRDATHAVIWLHGLGADGHDFEPVVPELGLDPELAVRFVFPTARPIPVTINGGILMPAWYDISEIDLRRGHDDAGLRRSAAQLVDLIARENERGVPCERLVLAGFSQGGAVALHVGLRHPEALAGVMALSCYLVGEATVEEERSTANREVSIFQAHGSFDPMVPIERGQAARQRLEELGYDVQWHEYPMMHQVCLEEIRDVGGWLSARLGAPEPDAGGSPDSGPPV